MIDTSDAAIEADLALAERGGTPGAIAVALGRAQVRATLRAAPLPAPEGRPAFLRLPDKSTINIQIAEGPFGDSYSIPRSAPGEARVIVAARLLGIDVELLRDALADGQVWSHEPAPEGEKRTDDELPLEAPAEPDFELDIEAGGTLDRLEQGDDIDADFFREAREARDR